MTKLAATIIALAISQAAAAGERVVLDSCFETGSYCSEAPLDTLNVGGVECGETFHGVVGRAAFPLVVNTGPIRISVLSIAPNLRTRYPAYVEIVSHSSETCSVRYAGAVVLAAEGFPVQCGGVWASVGPLDLTAMGVPVGGSYSLQIVGFKDLGTGYRSAGVACLRVVESGEPAPVAERSWTQVRRLYME